jgi:division/cell wall cluster transcriptional repressor MraZ
MTIRDARAAILLAWPFVCLAFACLIPAFRNPATPPGEAVAQVPPPWAEPQPLDRPAPEAEPAADPELPLSLWHQEPQTERIAPVASEVVPVARPTVPPPAVAEVPVPAPPPPPPAVALPPMPPPALTEVNLLPPSPPVPPPVKAEAPPPPVPPVVPLPAVVPPPAPVRPAVAVEPLPVVRPEAAVPARPLPLTGAYIAVLDGDHRLTLPRALREQLGDGPLLVSPGVDACVWLTTPAHLERLHERLEQARLRRADVKAFRRFYFAQAERVTVNGEGRVVLPERLVQFAGLSAEVVVVGADDHLELWDAGRWRRQDREEEQEE